MHSPLPGGAVAAHAERLFALSHDLLGAADARGRLRWVNAAWQRTMGWSEDELYTRPYLDFIHPEDRQRVAAFAERMAATPPGEGHTIEARARTHAGDYRWLRVSASVAGGPEPMVYLSGTDVTDLHEALDELAGERARYRLLAEHLPGTRVLLFDSELRLHLAAGEGLSEEPDTWMGRSLPDVAPGMPWEECGKHVEAVLAGEPRAFEYEADENGTAYGVQLVPLRDADSRLIGGMGVWRDVTERRRRTAELERSNAELERFASVVSHDLRQSLTAVSGFLSLLERRHGPELGEDARRLVGFALEGGSRMRSLVDDLLAYARVGHSSAREPEPVDVAALARRVADTVAPSAGVQVGPLPVIHARPRELEQLLTNLVGNAAKFVAPGTRPQIALTADRDGASWRFELADNGIGIPEQYAARVFGMLQRLHGSDAYPGTGIGLAIAQKVVEGHGGRIWVRPREGGGSVFCFTWPVE